MSGLALENAPMDDASVSSTQGASEPGSAFDRAKALLDPEIQRFGDGEITRFDVLAKADTIATECKVKSMDLRGWAKAIMDTMQAAAPETQPIAPPLPCATDPEPSRA